MSASATQSAGESFVRSLTASPDLQETARERGLQEAADVAGYDLTAEEIQASLREVVGEELPDHDTDGKRERSACTFTMCSCADEPISY